MTILKTPAVPAEVKRTDGDEPRAPLPGFAGQAPSIAMSMVVKDALLRHYGSFKAAAFYMGQMDQGQLCRDLDTGKFKFERLELCDLAGKASVVKALHEHFGNTDPKARRNRLIRNVRRAVDELAEDVA
jgi:hypothetical protein